MGYILTTYILHPGSPHPPSDWILLGMLGQPLEEMLPSYVEEMNLPGFGLLDRTPVPLMTVRQHMVVVGRHGFLHRNLVKRKPFYRGNNIIHNLFDIHL